MLGLRVTVPIACFRKGLAREYLETEILPPPSTCYGFLLSLVGETDRRKHIGVCVTAGLLHKPELSVVLRTVWRVKKTPLGSSGNTRPDYQQLLSDVRLVIWLDSTGESSDASLESRVLTAMNNPEQISRFGGLSLGESTHLVDEVCLLTCEKLSSEESVEQFVTSERGRLTLPVWVDHVGSAGTRYATGNLEKNELSPPALDRMPVISP
jgi:CRISPR-associated protein Cas5t